MPRPAHVHRNSVKTRYDGHRASVTKTETVELDTRLGLPLIGPARIARSTQVSLSRTPTSDSQRGRFYISDPANLDYDVACLAITDGRSGAGESSRADSRTSQEFASRRSSHHGSSRSLVHTLLGSVVSKATWSIKSGKDSRRSRSRPSTSAGVGYPRPADNRRTSEDNGPVCYEDNYSGSESDWSMGTGKTLRPADSVSQVLTRPPSYASRESRRSNKSHSSRKSRGSSKHTTTSRRH